MLVSPEQLSQVCGRPGDDSEVPRTAASIATGVVMGYCRWSELPNPVPTDVLAVALAVALRLVMNLGQWSSMSDSAGSEGGSAKRRDGGYQGLTLTEQTILNRWRQRSA